MLETELYYDEVELEMLDRLLAEQSLHEFCKQAWPSIEGPSIPFIDGWHIQAICEHLEALQKREIKKLIINVPPRSCKSTIISCMLAPWVWARTPHEKFLYASHSHSLCKRDSVKCRVLIQSPWYQARWGNRFKLLHQNTQRRYDNDKYGFRMISSMKAGSTGEGADWRLLDDPNNAGDVESDVKREAVNDKYSQELSTRITSPQTSVIVVVQQRTHAKDLSGYLMGQDIHKEWERLILPMEYSKNKQCKTRVFVKGIPFSDPRKKDGELLWPERFGKKEVEELKRDLRNEYRISGQLNQSPSPPEGGLIKKKWFQWWKSPYPPILEYVIQSWDTAMSDEKSENSYSACTTFGAFEDKNGIMNIILLSLWRGQVQYPELRERAQRLYHNYLDDGNTILKTELKPDMVLVEAKANGLSLIQDLRRAGIPATQFNPTKHGDKDMRVKLITHFIEGGRVWVPARPPDYTVLKNFADLFVEKCALFPKDDSRDLVDTLSQVLIRLNKSAIISNPKDVKPEEIPERDYPIY